MEVFRRQIPGVATHIFLGQARINVFMARIVNLDKGQKFFNPVTPERASALAFAL